MNLRWPVIHIKAILFFLYLLFVAAILSRQGIIDDLEAIKYTEAAEAMSKGDFLYSLEHYSGFFFYILFLLPATLIGKVQLALIPQIILSMVTANCIFNLIKKELNNIGLALVGMCLFLFNFFIQLWTIALFAESFFISVSTIFLTQIFVRDKSSMSILIILILSLIVMFSRPQGVLFIVPSLIFFAKRHSFIKKVGGIALLILVLSAVFYYILHHKVNCEHVYRPIAESDIICGFSQTKEVLTTSETCNILNAHRCLIKEYGWFHEMKLFGNKVVSLFTFTRPYYSKSHNLIIGLNYIILALSMIPLLKLLKRKKIKPLFYIIILLNTLLIGITYNEWHGRYLAVLMPMLIILATRGLHDLLKYFKREPAQ